MDKEVSKIFRRSLNSIRKSLDEMSDLLGLAEDPVEDPVEDPNLKDVLLEIFKSELRPLYTTDLVTILLRSGWTIHDRKDFEREIRRNLLALVDEGYLSYSNIQMVWKLVEFKEPPYKALKKDLKKIFEQERGSLTFNGVSYALAKMGWDISVEDFDATLKSSLQDLIEDEFLLYSNIQNSWRLKRQF